MSFYDIKLDEFESTGKTFIRTERGRYDNRVVKYQPDFVQGVNELIFLSSLNNDNVMRVLDRGRVKAKHPDSHITEFISITMPKMADINDDERDDGYESADDNYDRPMFNEEGDIIDLFTEIARAIYYLEYNGVIQGDVKMENIFYDHFMRGYVLADFDLARAGTECFVNRGGTTYTFPIELANGRPMKDASGDIYSLGIVIVNFMLRDNFYDFENAITDIDELYKRICSRTDHKRRLLRARAAMQAFDFPHTDLVIQCLAYDPKDRPTAKQLVEILDPLFKPDIAHRVFKDELNIIHSLEKNYTAPHRALEMVAEYVSVFPDVLQSKSRLDAIVCAAHAVLLIICGTPFSGTTHDDIWKLLDALDFRVL